MLIVYNRSGLKKLNGIFAFIFLWSIVSGDISYAQANTPPSNNGAAAAAATPPAITEEVSFPQAGNITVNFKGVDILTVLNYLSEASGVDIIPSPGVTGTVTMRLRDKPWEVALDIVTRNYGYAYSREGDIIRVMPKSMLQAEDTVTEVLSLNYLMGDIQLEKGTAEGGGGGIGEATVKEEAKSLTETINAVNAIIDTKKGEKATYIPGANAIVVTAIPARLNKVKEMLSKVDTKKPQILLDAKVIEITLTGTDKMGVDWNAVISAAGARRPMTFPFTNTGILPFLSGSQTNFYPSRATATATTTGQSNASFPNAYPGANGIDTTIAPVANSIFSYGTLDFSTFTATLSMLKNKQDVKILSCPRITTLNNQKATIKVIDKIMLQKTQSTTQTAGIVTVSFETTDEAREVGVKLTVLPHVNNDGEITVNLMPEVSTNSGFDLVTVGVAATATMSLTFSSREANTRVRVKDNDTIFIGGLISDRTTKQDDRFPILGDMFKDVPILGGLFRVQSNVTTKTEVVFFVTVHLLQDGTMSFQNINMSQSMNKAITEKGYNDLVDMSGKPTPPIIMTGEFKESKEKVEVPVTIPATDKKKKPWLDFTKKSK